MLSFSLLSIHTDMFGDLLQFQNFKYHPYSQNLHSLDLLHQTSTLNSRIRYPTSIRNLHSDRQLNIVRTECLIFPIIHKL